MWPEDKGQRGGKGHGDRKREEGDDGGCNGDRLLSGDGRDRRGVVS